MTKKNNYNHFNYTTVIMIIIIPLEYEILFII